MTIEQVALCSRQLYKTLAPGAKPRFETIATIMRAMNVGFAVESRLPVRTKKARKLKAA